MGHSSKPLFVRISSSCCSRSPYCQEDYTPKYPQKKIWPRKTGLRDRRRSTLARCPGSFSCPRGPSSSCSISFFQNAIDLLDKKFAKKGYSPLKDVGAASANQAEEEDCDSDTEVDEAKWHALHVRISLWLNSIRVDANVAIGDCWLTGAHIGSKREETYQEDQALSSGFPGSVSWLMDAETFWFIRLSTVDCCSLGIHDMMHILFPARIVFRLLTLVLVT